MLFFKKWDLITPLLILILLFTLGAAMTVKPGTSFYIIMILLTIAVIGISAARNFILFKIGTRNIVRRRRYSVIIISGLLIGTVIISSSLIIGDTMEKMIVNLHYKMFHEVDEVIYGNDADGSMLYITEEDYLLLRGEILEIDDVEGVTGEIEETVSVINVDAGQTEPNFIIIGYNTSSSEFGSFHAKGKKVPFDIEPNEVYIDRDSAKALDARKGDNLTVLTQSGSHFFVVREIIDADGRAGWAMGKGIFVPLSTAGSILNATGHVNIIKVTNDGGVVGGEKYCDDVVEEIEDILVDFEYTRLKLKRNKADEVEEGREGISEFTDMFLVFGSFSIIAGVILIVNIFIMLAEERKGEMGISRAVGMKQLHLGRSYLYEGSVYAFISALIGAFLGILVSYAVLYFTESIFSSFGDQVSFEILENFDYRLLSIIQAFTFGMLITLITVSLASKRVAKLNIVRAIRNIPEPKLSKKSIRMLVVGMGLIVLGIVLALLSLFVLGNYELASLYMGISVFFLGIGFLLRRYIGDRWGFTIACICLIVLWIIPGTMLGLDKIVDDLGGMEMFILSGLFLVSSAVVLFVYNSTQILRGIIRLWGLTNRPTASLKTAASYPMKNKFRTGMTIYMFALIIFTIVVMYMIIGVMSFNMERITREQMGGLDIVGISNPNNPIDNITLEVEENENLSLEDFNGIYAISSGYIQLNTSERDPDNGRYVMVPYPMYGYGRDFAENNSWTFAKRSSNYKTDREAWEAVYNDPDLVILDGAFLQTDDFGPPNPVSGLDTALDRTLVITALNGSTVNKTVVGYLDQFIFGGLFMSDNATLRHFNLDYKGIYLFDVADDDRAEELAKDIERELNIDTIELRSAVKEITNVMEQFFNLFTAFMSLGLVVGIAGLGIITLRAVHERRQEIGVMRAIGFKRRNVTMAFVQESAFISIVGIVLGVVLGVAIGYSIWYDGFRPMDYDFYIPWGKILVVSLIAFFATALFTIPPSYSASKVSPAEALRFD